MAQPTQPLPALPPLDPRIPQWTLDRLSPRDCPLCSSAREPLFIRPDGLPVAWCAGCALWFVQALPPVDEIDKLYQGYWFTFRPKQLTPAFAASLQEEDFWLEGDVRLARLEALSSGLKGVRLLEIGCGAGELLAVARRRGATVFGNDISPESCAFVRDQLAVPVFQGPIDSARFLSQYGSMDLIVMSDLIEHPPQPLDLLSAALEILVPGGLLLILTPNGGAARSSLDAALEWVGFRVDLDHLQYFSAHTIEYLAARLHCRIEHLESFGFPGLTSFLKENPSLPSLSFQAAPPWKRTLKQHEIVKRIIRARDAMHLAWRGPRADPRTGCYHLHAILRKSY